MKTITINHQLNLELVRTGNAFEIKHLGYYIDQTVTSFLLQDLIDIVGTYIRDDYREDELEELYEEVVDEIVTLTKQDVTAWVLK